MKVIKWSLVALGAYLACGMAVIELHERRVGIGLGLVVACALAGIKGVIMAWQMPDSSSERPR